MTFEQIQASRDRLHAFIRAKTSGGCLMLSRGADCECPLCDVDRLVTAARVDAAMASRGTVNPYDLEAVHRTLRRRPHDGSR